MDDQKRDRNVQPPEGSDKLSHHDRKLKRKEMREKMKGAAPERTPAQSSSPSGKKLPLPE